MSWEPPCWFAHFMRPGLFKFLCHLLLSAFLLCRVWFISAIFCWLLASACLACAWQQGDTSTYRAGQTDIDTWSYLCKYDMWRPWNLRNTKRAKAGKINIKSPSILVWSGHTAVFAVCSPSLQRLGLTPNACSVPGMLLPWVIFPHQKTTWLNSKCAHPRILCLGSGICCQSPWIADSLPTFDWISSSPSMSMLVKEQGFFQYLPLPHLTSPHPPHPTILSCHVKFLPTPDLFPSVLRFAL